MDGIAIEVLITIMLSSANEFQELFSLISSFPFIHALESIHSNKDIGFVMYCKRKVPMCIVRAQTSKEAYKPRVWLSKAQSSGHWLSHEKEKTMKDPEQVVFM